MKTSALRVRQLANSLNKTTQRRSSTVVVAAAAFPKPVRAPITAAGVILTSNAGAAYADESSAVDSAVSSIVDVVKATGDAVKAGLGVAEQGLDAANKAYQTVAPMVKATADTVAPAVKSALSAATPVVQAGVRAAGEAASSAKPALERVLSETGVDTKTVAGVTDTAVSTAKPLVESLVHFITTSPPTVLAETAVGVVAAYYLLPPVLKASFGLLRGYAGDVSPPAALDAIATRGNAVMVDIRTMREKEQQGLPDLPNSGKLIELELATISDRKVRGQLRDIGSLEIKITAMQIAALKRLSKGAPIYLLDRNGGTAKSVAKELAKRGYSKVYVISGGFSNWQRDRLGTKLASSVSRVEVLLPGSGSFGGRIGSARQLTSGSGSKAVEVLPPQRRQQALPSKTSGGR